MRKLIAFTIVPLLLIPLLVTGQIVQQPVRQQPAPQAEPAAPAAPGAPAVPKTPAAPVEPSAVPAAPTDDSAPPATDAATDEPDQEIDPQTASVLAAAKAFDEAYNNKDAAAIAGLFSENAELVDTEGAVHGVKAIQARFEEVFKLRPDATIETEVLSARFPAPTLAIVEGATFLTIEPETDPIEYRYVAVHVSKGEGWNLASVHAEPVEDMPVAGEALDALGWLVGDWVDESDDSSVWTSCRWSEDGNWLLQDYEVQIADGPVISGSQRIGWDPVRQQIRSWSFDSTGGATEGAWTQDGDRWVIDASGFTGEGLTGTAIRILTPLGPDEFEVSSLHRTIAGESIPDSQVRVVRAPPEPEVAEETETDANAATEPASEAEVGSDPAPSSEPAQPQP